MSDILLYGSLALFTFMQVFATLIAIKVFLLIQSNGKSIIPELIAALSLSVLTVLLQCFAVGDLAVLVVQSVCIAVFALYYYLHDRQKVLLYVFFYTVVLTFLDFAALIISGFVSGDYMVLLMSKEEYGGIQIIFLFGVRFLFLLFALAIHKKSDFSQKQIHKAFGYAGVLGLFSMIALSQQKVIDIPADTVFVWLIFFVIIIVVFILLNMRTQIELEKEIAYMREMEKELLEREYATLNNAYSINARMFHDFQNHAGVLRELLNKANYDEAVTYLNDLSEPLETVSSTTWTGNETIDYLINSKLVAADTGQIRTEINVEFPRRTNIRANDLCAILGNLLDNALEACREVSNKDDRFIELTIRRINNMLIIRLRNSADRKPIIDEKGLQSTKTGSGVHGWGIKSVQTAADRYDGIMKMDYSNHIFQAVVSLSFEGVEIKE